MIFNTADTRVKAAFEYPAFACPNDTVIFVDKSTGPVSTWLWNFGNGNTSTLQSPPGQFFNTQSTTLQNVPVSLIVGHVNGCKDTLVQKIQVPNNCYIAVPSGFTPNGDGLNDYLYPLNAYKATNLLFRVYNRYGQLVFETKDWTRKWDGKLSGSPQDAGTYVWMLQYTDENGKSISIKGTTVLIR
jgi:gliding motility-associated-like protein